MANYLWLFVVAGGAALLALALAYGNLRQRKIAPKEKEFQEERVRDMYDKEPTLQQNRKNG